jgi:glycerol-3-phosphate dehydrogenase
MSTGTEAVSEVAVIGAGVVGCATALTLARRGVSVALLEAEPDLGLAASSTNSGILHMGFDSPPGELETELILASAALREPVLAALSVPVLHCGARLRAEGEAQRQAVAAIADRAWRNGVTVVEHDDGTLEIPGEAVTDPVFYTLALAGSATRHGAVARVGFRVSALKRTGREFAIGAASGETWRSRVIVNCAGLHADTVARLVGDDSFEIYPRKGEFLVFDATGGAPLDAILMPVPSERTRGVLVFPTVDGKVIAGPTAVDLEDKQDWSVRPDARAEILPKARALHPELEGAEPIATYAGLRPAGRGVNYVVGASRMCPGFVNVAAIRSTGLTASLAIARHVTEIVAAQGIALGPERELEPGPPPSLDRPWWRRTADYRASGAL